MKKYFFLVLLSIVICSLKGQNLQDGQLLWDEENRLVQEDFKLEINDSENEALYSQFAISYQVSGFSFLSKNLNQKILNLFMGEASWINKGNNIDIDKQMAFQQLQFDLCEVYTREFRKEALINKKKILKGYDYLQALNNRIMSDFAKERAVMIEETNSGRNTEALSIWEEKIKARLDSLHLFNYNNKKKIKLDEI